MSDEATKEQQMPFTNRWGVQRDIEPLLVKDILDLGYRPSVTDAYRRAYYALIDLGISIAGSTTKLVEDIKARTVVGVKKYKQPLRSFNGRDPEVDMYQEILDALQYGRQILEERDERRRVGIGG